MPTAVCGPGNPEGRSPRRRTWQYPNPLAVRGPTDGGTIVRAWVVRAGRESERVAAALRDNVVIAGWTRLGDLTTTRSREDIRRIVRATYPKADVTTIANWTGQLLRFRHAIAVGDLVVMPCGGTYAIGRVTGDYEFLPDAPDEFQHVRPVTWLRTDVARTAFHDDLAASMGSILTVFEVSRFAAADRIAAVAETGADPGSPTARDDMPKSPEELQQALASEDPAAAPKRLDMTVRELLAIWGMSRRWSGAVDQIQRDLADLGLTTDPAFTEGSLDSRIEVLPAVVETEPAGGAGEGNPQPTAVEFAGPEVGGAPDGETGAEPTVISYRISNLEAANKAPVSVHEDDDLDKAVTVMISYDYSQLPVLDGYGRLRGVVSWKSIGRARLTNPAAGLTEAMVSAPEAHHDDDLLEWIHKIGDTGFVLVKGPDHRIVGIVTASDVSHQFDTRLRPFVLVEEIERRLRKVADDRLTVADLKNAVLPQHKKKVKSAKDLSFGNYRYLFKDDDVWARLGWPVHQETVLDLLKECGEFRNELMHFSPDPITPEQLEPVNGLLRLMRSLDPNG